MACTIPQAGPQGRGHSSAGGRLNAAGLDEIGRHFANGMQAGFLGTRYDWTDVLIVGAWGLAGLVLAIRYFRWEPRT